MNATVSIVVTREEYGLLASCTCGWRYRALDDAVGSDLSLGEKIAAHLKAAS